MDTYLDNLLEHSDTVMLILEKGVIKTYWFSKLERVNVIKDVLRYKDALAILSSVDAYAYANDLYISHHFHKGVAVIKLKR